MAVNDSVVWAVNGPIATDARQAREIAHITTGGETGVSTPESLEVKAYPTPTTSVRILPGGFVAQATPGDTGTGYASAPWQSYMRSIYQTTDVPIQATDSSGPRADVIGIEIVDPQFEGTDTSEWTDDDWASHQFWRPRVRRNTSPDAAIISHFPSMNRPFVPLARVNIPASTEAITNAMITDLRYLAIDRQETPPPIVERPTQDYTIDGTTNLGGMDGPVVPQWANYVTIDAEVIGAAPIGSGDVTGTAAMVVQHDNHPNTETVPVFFSASTAWDRFTIPVMGASRIHPEDQGRPIRLWFRLEVTGGDGAISLAQTKTGLRVRLTFQRKPINS